MPRPNKPRHIGGEASLAERVAFERESRGWSYEGLALRMEKVGCPINASAIYKIERADPPRRVTADEFIGFSRVFGIALDDLLVPAAAVKQDRLIKGLDNLSAKFFDLRAAQDAYDETVAGLTTLAGDLGYGLEIPAASSAEVDADTVWVVDIRQEAS